MLDTTTDRCADGVIETFLEVRGEILELRKGCRAGHGMVNTDDYASTSLWPASIELAQKLNANLFYKTSEKQYRDFMDAYGKASKSSKPQEWSYASLVLYIPNAPDPNPLLNLLKRGTDKSLFDSDSQVIPSDPATRKFMHFTCSNLETVLQGANRHEDASWVANTRARLFTESEQRHFHATHNLSTIGLNRKFQRVFVEEDVDEDGRTSDVAPTWLWEKHKISRALRKGT